MQYYASIQANKKEAVSRELFFILVESFVRD